MECLLKGGLSHFSKKKNIYMYCCLETKYYFQNKMATNRKARLAQNLTQEELGERIRVQRAQISKLEKGKSVITLPTMSRVFQALGIASATLDLGMAGKIALW